MAEHESNERVFREQWRRYRRALVEMWFVLGVWLVAGVWVVTVSYVLGWQVPVEEIRYPFGLGIPAWAFWGVLVPWLVCNAVTVYFCFWGIEDIPLAELDADSVDAGTGPRHEGDGDAE